MAGSASANGNLQLTTGQTGDGAMAIAFASLFALTNFLVEPALSVPNSPTSVTLPGSPAKVVFIQNLHATQTLTVTWTPNGGASNPVVTLQPGEFILLGGVSASGGITALSLQGSGAGTTTKLVLAA